jgi:hypothetical protein
MVRNLFAHNVSSGSQRGKGRNAEYKRAWKVTPTVTRRLVLMFPLERRVQQRNSKCRQGLEGVVWKKARTTARLQGPANRL